jgi:hypothetical protein
MTDEELIKLQQELFAAARDQVAAAQAAQNAGQ